MNASLQREIILHIFNTLGIIKTEFIGGFIQPLISDTFLLDKKIGFEVENGKKENPIWAASVKIDNSEIKLMVADITDDMQEFVLITQMDDFYPCAIQIVVDDKNDFGSMFFNIQNNDWAPLSTIYQAKMLVGFEHLTETFSNWTKLINYNDLYKTIIGFLTFIENE